MNKPDEVAEQQGERRELRAPRGTRDVTSPEIERWRRVEDAARDTFERFGFREMRTPIFEDSAVFEKGTGEDSEIVQKEMYRFRDLGDHDLTLRPEGTPPVIRAYVEHRLGQSLDVVRYYYIGPMFRYERPQKGRYRQFHQIGVEALGSESAAVDAEIIDMAMSWLAGLGVASLQLKINSVGDGSDRPAFLETLVAAQRELLDEMSADSQRRHQVNPLRVFDSKDPKDQAVIDKLPTIIDHLSPENRAHFDEVCGYLSDWGVPFTIEPRLVRGLDYYRRTVFEITSSALGAQDSLLGGGRYDGLVAQMGGDDVPGVGFAAGLERIVLALPEGAPEPLLDCYVVTVNRELSADALRMLRALRAAGLRCTADFQGRSMKAQMKAANRSGAPATVILGPDEIAKGVCTLKMMESGEQREVSLENLATVLADEMKHDHDGS
ncbi:MAG: histidine--tRNA ligase [Acidobacteriota bacterium]|jgi:histidyl-tRNA synthetase